MFIADDHAVSGLDVSVQTFEPMAASQQASESPLTAEEIHALREHLEHMRQWLLQRIAAVEEQSARNATRTRVAVSVTDIDEGAWEQSLAQQTIAGKRLMLSEIMQAFERIRSNTYGRCLSDGSPLSRSLLEDMPWAKYCPRCASRHT